MSDAPTSSRRVIPLTPADDAALVARTGAMVSPDLRDTLRRPLRDLRISVTDRCNFRCSYCMPKGVFGRDHAFLPHDALLSFEEITRVAQASIPLGVRKIRLTGGEPLLRKNLEILVAQLSELRTWDGQPLDITLTTNGTVLKKKAAALREAGLKRVTVSLDALDDRIFKSMNDMDVPVADVLDGIAAAQAAGLSHIKINMVVKKGTNDDQILPMARYFRGSGMALRFIEFMDVGQTNGWRMDEVMPSAQVIARIHAELPLIALDATSQGETAQRYGYLDAQGQHDPSLGEVGVISSVTQAFCHDCNRARLSTEGKIYTCLFASQGVDLRRLLRDNASPADLSQAIAAIWTGRGDRYSQLRALGLTETSGPRVEMHYIGG